MPRSHPPRPPEGQEAVRPVSNHEDRTTSGLVKSAERVMRIFEYFDDVQSAARVGEVCEHLDIPQSSASALLGSLARLGYLDYDAERRTYFPSIRVSLLGSWLNVDPTRNGRLLQLTEEVARGTGHTVVLAVRNGMYAQYVHVIQATTAIRYHIPKGTHRPLVWSSAGFVMLQETPGADIRRLVTRWNATVTDEGARCQYDAVLRNVETARREGYFFSRGLVTRGAGAIALRLPVSADRRDRPLVIVVAGLIDELEASRDRILELIRRAVATHLGGGEEPRS